MLFEQYLPSAPLRPYIRHFAIAESDEAREYKVFPAPGMVIGFQYQGQLSAISDASVRKLTVSGITGISDSYKVFGSAERTGSVLVYFTETGFTHFTSQPAHELFNLSLSLEDVFSREKVKAVEEQLPAAGNGQRRVRIVEQILLGQLKDIQADRLVVEAVKRIYESRGTIRIGELSEQLFISKSPFEKRFRKTVGTTPKKFASIVRFHALLSDMDRFRSLTELCYEHHFFDQAHFIKTFRRFTGDTPDAFRTMPPADAS